MFFDGYGDLGTSFEQTYRCYPASFIDKPQNENGDKIIMPPSAHDHLASLHIDYPMLFELRNAATERISHCGVLEFIAEEGMIYMPYWMMENLLLQEGDIVLVKNVTLPKGTYVKLQPDTKDLLDISDPKAILETMLRNFSCLTTGDSIMVAYNNKKYYIDIIETKPSNAITIIETDCEVDFAPPIDYKEHEKPVATVPSTKALAKGPVCADKAMPASSPPSLTTFKGKETEEAASLEDLMKETRAEQLLDKLEAPPAQSSFLGKDDFFNSPEETASLEDLMREAGVEQLLAKLEAPPAQSSFLSSASSNGAAIHIQKGLILSLQSSSDVDNMIVIANGIFNVLRNLNIDFSSFYEKVKMFIGCSALKVQLANFSDESSSHKELEAQNQQKKFNFDEFSGYHKDLCASLAKTDDRIADLDQKIAQTKDLLKQLEHELSSVQAERTYFTNNLAQVSENVCKSENEVQAALEALTQYKNKSSHHEIVKQAFDRVKASLR